MPVRTVDQADCLLRSADLAVVRRVRKYLDFHERNRYFTDRQILWIDLEFEKWNVSQQGEPAQESDGKHPY